MADAVYLSLEGAVRDAEELETSGSFSRAEVKYIFLKRARFEYLLRRHGAPKARFLSYIKFETDLYKLHRLRKEQQTGNPNLRNPVAHGFIRKIHSLYQRALGKFRGSVGLWLEFTTFCYSHGNQRLLSEVVSQALRLNPSCAGLWSFAATWEYKHKSDISAARYLLLRGLRNCKQSKVLWHGYFRLEMLYAEDLRARRRILGARERCDGHDEMGTVARVVFDSAAASHPDDATFHLQFISIALGMRDGQTWTKPLVEYMVSRITGFFCTNTLDKDVTLQVSCLESLTAAQNTVSNSTVLKIAVEHALRVKSLSGKSVSNLANFLRKNGKHSPLGVDGIHSLEHSLQFRINFALLGLVKLASLQSNPHASGNTTAKHPRQNLRNAVDHRVQAAHVLTTKSPAGSRVNSTLQAILSTRSSQMCSSGDASTSNDVYETDAFDFPLELRVGRNLVRQRAGDGMRK